MGAPLEVVQPYSSSDASILPFPQPSLAGGSDSACTVHLVPNRALGALTRICAPLSPQAVAEAEERAQYATQEALIEALYKL